MDAVHNNGGEGKNNEENGRCDEAVAKDILNDTIGSESESQMCLDVGDVEGLTIEDIMQKTFDDDAYEFYKNFGRYHGFGVRKGDSRRDDDGNVRKRSFFFVIRRDSEIPSTIIDWIGCEYINLRREQIARQSFLFT
ncbi:uncharacterized protein DS421_13g414370 [Arachis hypogaea]|nr:uncharacterized protein DS421_13g414370 [Arachis hypogaea]